MQSLSKSWCHGCSVRLYLPPDLCRTLLWLWLQRVPSALLKGLGHLCSSWNNNSNMCCQGQLLLLAVINKVWICLSYGKDCVSLQQELKCWTCSHFSKKCSPLAEHLFLRWSNGLALWHSWSWNLGFGCTKESRISTCWEAISCSSWVPFLTQGTHLALYRNDLQANEN